MHLAAELFAREALFLAFVSAFGSGIVVHLDERFDGAVKLGLAPALGLCLGVSVFTSLEWFWSGEQASIVAPVLAAVSLAEALRFVLRRRNRTTNGLRVSRSLAIKVAQVVIVVGVVSLPVSSALLQNHSVGPTTYDVFDAVGYVAETDQLQIESIHAVYEATQPPKDMIASYTTRYLDEATQQLDIAPFSSALNALIGLHSTDTQAPFMLAVLVSGALGAMAAIRFALRRRTWFAVFGGCLFGGPFFLQLFFDGSQAALAGIALILPLVMLSYETAKNPRWQSLVITALVIGGLAAVYPIFGPALFACACVLGFVAAVRELANRHRRAGRVLALWTVRLIGMGALALVFNIVAGLRERKYWIGLLHGNYVVSGFPPFHLSLGVVLGWLLQTRGLYSFALGAQSVFIDVIPALLIPALVIVVIVPTLRRNRAAWALVLLALIAGSLGGFEQVRNACGYCEDRNLLPAEPALIFIVATGLAIIYASGKQWQKVASLGTAAVLVGSVILSAVNERNRFSDNAYFLTSSVRHMIAQIPKSAVIDVEGFGEGPRAPGEEPLVYEAVWEYTNGRVSVAADVDDHGGVAYFGTSPLDGPWFRKDYAYVLTRVPGIATTRHVIAREPGVAAERRERADVLVDSGLVVPNLPSEDPQGAGWIDGPVEFVATSSDDRALYLHFGVALPTATSAVPAQHGVVTVRSGSSLTGCTRMSGSHGIFSATIDIPPALSARLTSMSAGTSTCLGGQLR